MTSSKGAWTFTSSFPATAPPVFTCSTISLPISRILTRFEFPVKPTSLHLGELAAETDLERSPGNHYASPKHIHKVVVRFHRDQARLSQLIPEHYHTRYHAVSRPDPASLMSKMTLNSFTTSSKPMECLILSLGPVQVEGRENQYITENQVSLLPRTALAASTGLQNWA